MGAEILAVRVRKKKTDTKQIKTQGHDRVTCFLNREGCQGGLSWEMVFGGQEGTTLVGQRSIEPLVFLNCSKALLYGGRSSYNIY